jgi:hypothetical protein
MIEITVKIYSSLDEIRAGLDLPNYSDAQLIEYVTDIAQERVSDELYSQGVGQ